MRKDRDASEGSPALYGKHHKYAGRSHPPVTPRGPMHHRRMNGACYGDGKRHCGRDDRKFRSFRSVISRAVPSVGSGGMRRGPNVPKCDRIPGLFAERRVQHDARRVRALGMPISVRVYIKLIKQIAEIGTISSHYVPT